MAVYSCGPKAFTAGGTIPLYSRVALDSASGTTVSVADADEVGIGTVTAIGSGGGSAASGERVTVHLDNLGGTVKVITSEAIAVGSLVFSVGSGEVSDVDTGLSKPIGVALQASGADQDVIEILLLPQPAVAQPIKEELILGTLTASLIIDTNVLTRTMYGSGTIDAVFVRAVSAVTTAAKATTATFAIGGTPITTGVVSVTSAGQTPDGAEQSATPSAANVFADGDSLTCTFSSTTAFAEGIFEVGVRLTRS